MTLRPAPREDGYAMAALLVAMGVMGIMLSVAMPVWQTWVQREKEAELVFRAEQYAQAIDRFSRQTGGFPTSLEALADGKYIRKLYKDPITGEDFQPVYLGQVAGIPGGGTPPGGSAPAGRGTPASAARGRAAGAGPIIGVVSTSPAKSLRLYNGRGAYNEWVVVSTAATQQAGTGGRGTQAPGLQTPGRGAGGRQGVPGRGGFPGRGPMPGRGQPGGGRQMAPSAPGF